MLPVNIAPGSVCRCGKARRVLSVGGRGDLTMDAATLAGFDPVWPVLAAAAAMLIAIVIGIVRHD